MTPLALSETPIPLLGGRLTIRAPEAARVEARRPSLMAAEESPEEETRVVVDHGDERLVLMVYEMFALAGKCFEELVSTLVEGWSRQPRSLYRVEKLELATPIPLAFAIVPLELDLSRDAIYLFGTFVAHPDGTVQHLAFYVNPAAAKDPEGCRDLARRMASTLAPGDRRLDAGRGDRRLGSSGPIVTLPEGYVVTRQKGPDFDVYRLRKLVSLDARSPAIGAYFGRHPSYQYDQTSSKSPIDKAPGRLLGRDIEWHSWSLLSREAGGTVLYREAILPFHESGKGGELLHIHLSASSVAEIGELLLIVATLRRG